jgi:maltose O-acetyltransferase
MTQNSLNLSPTPSVHTIEVDVDTCSEKRAGRLARVRAKGQQLFKEEFVGLHPRLLLARILLWPFPINVGGRVRVRILRGIGFDIGHGTVMAGTPEFSGDKKSMYRNLTIGENCWFNIHCFLDLGSAITIGKNVYFGHQVMVLTNSHEIGPSTGRASTINSRPVTIGSGAWLGARVTILPGVNIGAGAVVAAGSVVHEDVPANTLVAGTPARMVRSLSQS